ncbi:MAG: histidine phosphatase family protein [bacterium]
MKRIFLIRHGEIPSNTINRYAGWSDEELTETGIKQVRAVSEKLKAHPIKKLYTSPLRRAVQTAEIFGESFNLAPIVEPDLKELKLGPWEGLCEKEISKKYPEEWFIWYTNPAKLDLPGRERLEELAERAVRAIERIRDDMADEESVVAVTHVAIIRVLLLWAQDYKLSLYKNITVPNGAILDLFSGNFI